MGKDMEQTLTDNCQHVAIMIDLTQYQETNFERRKVKFKVN